MQESEDQKGRIMAMTSESVHHAVLIHLQGLIQLSMFPWAAGRERRKEAGKEGGLVMGCFAHIRKQQFCLESYLGRNDFFFSWPRLLLIHRLMNEWDVSSRCKSQSDKLPWVLGCYSAPLKQSDCHYDAAIVNRVGKTVVYTMHAVGLVLWSTILFCMSIRHVFDQKLWRALRTRRLLN